MCDVFNHLQVTASQDCVSLKGQPPYLNINSDRRFLTDDLPNGSAESRSGLILDRPTPSL